MYTFVTDWSFDAPVEAVWEELMRPEDWPAWWKGVLSVEVLAPGDADGLGAYRRMAWRSRLPYTLRFNSRTIAIDRPYVAEGVADGDLEGRGKWTLARTSSGTHVRYEWNVETTRPWMRWLAPVARPFFAWNHDVIMRWGREGLERRLARRNDRSP
jgi:uncharacterized protein YndB with AHSA1/START domain